MAGKAKKIGLIVLILALAVAAAGYLLWNKPHTNVESSEGISITAGELYKSFTADTAVAGKKFIDKVVEVSGTVQSTSVNQQQQKIVVLKTDSGGAINCTMEQKDAAIKEGTVIKLKGVCTGIGEGDAEMGILGDVYLIRCYIAE
jgi:tRNA_anti-like